MLRVDNASVYFAARDGRPVHALDRVSLEIPDRGFVVALGTSGCGKSTLLNAMAGFLPLSSGSITLNGHEVQAPGAERGVVFQKDTLLPWKSVAENVALGLNSQASAARSGENARTNCCAWSAFRISPTPRPMNFPAACVSASASRARSRQIPPSC